jgi:hypothetical protein
MKRRNFLSAVGAGIGAAALPAGMLQISGGAFAQNADSGAVTKKNANETKTFELKREIPVEDGYDIVVARGGHAGSAAAICAARLGAKVLIVEATGCLGGMGTSGIVAAFGPIGNGKTMMARGLLKEILDKMYKRGFLKPGATPKTYENGYHKWTPYHPEGLKLVLDELAEKAGLEIRFFTRVVDADVDNRSK